MRNAEHRLDVLVRIAQIARRRAALRFAGAAAAYRRSSVFALRCHRAASASSAVLTGVARFAMTPDAASRLVMCELQDKRRVTRHGRLLEAARGADTRARIDSDTRDLARRALLEAVEIEAMQVSLRATAQARERLRERRMSERRSIDQALDVWRLRSHGGRYGD